MAKINLETISIALEGTGWKCINTSYTNLKTLMKFNCAEGHLVETTWEKLRNKRSCPVCKINLKKKIQNIESKPKTNAFRILALDQASYRTGYSIYDDTTLIAYGFYETDKTQSLDRIVDMCDWLQSMIELWKPDLVGIEEIQYNPRSNTGDVERNHNTFKLLGQVMGSIMLTVARNKCVVNTVLIPTWRGHCKIKGNKRADQKRSAQLLVKQWHGVTVTDDESDAICIGKYFADQNRSMEKPKIGDYESLES